MSTATEVRCPKCGGPCWDNTRDKRSPRAPDYKCKDRDNCDGAIWLDRQRNGGGTRNGQRAPQASAPSPAVGDLPGDPAASYGAPTNGAAPARPTLMDLAKKYDACLGIAVKIAAKHEGPVQFGADAITSIAATLYIEANRRGVEA